MLSSPVDATLGIRTNTFTITDDDGSTVTLVTNAVTVAETDESVEILVIRSGATNTTVAVDFTTVNVTALAGADYTDTNDTLVFLPGETTNVLILLIDDDLLYESTETFRFVLVGITNSSLGITTNTVSITDDDLAVVEFTMSTATPSEIDGGLTVTVERTGATNTTVSVASPPSTARPWPRSD